MLRIAKSLREMDFRQLMDIYEEGNLNNAREHYPQLPLPQALLETEQDFYAYLKDIINWKHLIRQNVWKANLITQNKLSWPEQKDYVEQIEVFNAQVEKYVIPKGVVAILNAFPMFLYYYFPKERFETE